MTTDMLTEHQRRARLLASDLERRALLLLAGVPSDDATLRGHVLATAGVLVSAASFAHPQETAQLSIPAGLLLGPATVADVQRLTLVTTDALGVTLDRLTSRQAKERDTRRRRADTLLRVDILTRFREAVHLGSGARDHVADSLALFEDLPVMPKHFSAVHAAVADGSGLALIEGGYQLRGTSGRKGIHIRDVVLGAGRTREELRTSAADAHDEFAGTVELVLALLALAHVGDEGADALLTQAGGLGLDLSDVSDPGQATADELDHLADVYGSGFAEARLRWNFRRSNHIRAQVTPKTLEAERISRERREAAEQRDSQARRWATFEAAREAGREARRREASFERRAWHVEGSSDWSNDDKHQGDEDRILGFGE
jgi:hypothetical protein